MQVTPYLVLTTPFPTISDRRGLADGYSWHKYGQKVVKAGEYPRSYYRCTFLNCPSKKTVERSKDGQVTEIVYIGGHNHTKPQNIGWNSIAGPQLLQSGGSEAFEHTYSGVSATTAVATSYASASYGSNEIRVSLPQAGNSSSDKFDEHEAESKTWIARFNDAPSSNSGSDEEEPFDGQVLQSNDASSTCKKASSMLWSDDTAIAPQVGGSSGGYGGTLSDDGYYWRKYGKKGVKGSKYPHIYYKCTFLNCPVKKKVMRPKDDNQITNIVYKGTHNHTMPQNTGWRWRKDGGGEDIDLNVRQRDVKWQRLVVKTMSDVDIHDDGFRWRMYRQKVVGGNPNPRSSYKCATPGCLMRKHVERPSHDPLNVITTYVGEHNHGVRTVKDTVERYRPTPPPGDSARLYLAPTSETQPALADQTGQSSAPSSSLTGAAPSLLLRLGQPDAFLHEQPYKQHDSRHVE